MDKVLLIANPISGQGKASQIAPEIAQKLEKSGLSCEVYFTQGQGDGSKRIAQIQSDVSVVAGVGGDGTLNEIVNGLSKPMPVALFPLGTANVLALELQLPKTTGDFAMMLQRRRTQEIDLIRANGKLGFFALGVGFDGMVIAELQRKRKGRIRKLSYIPIVLRCLRRYRTPQLRVHVDGLRFENISFALVANTKNYGGRVFQLSPDRKLDDGLYECYLFQGRGRWALFRYLIKGLFHRLLGKEDPIVVQGRKFRIESQIPNESVPYELDGDFGGQTPVEVEVIPKGMRIIVP